MNCEIETQIIMKGIIRERGLEVEGYDFLYDGFA